MYPQLIEISMVSGTFQVGERITGTTRPLGVLPITNDDAEDAQRGLSFSTGMSCTE